MLRDFGIVTVVDLTVSLLGVMIVLPAALMWAEEHGPFRVRDLLAARRLPQGSGRHHVNDDRDRFEDLSPGERLAERDRTHPEPVRRPEMPQAGNKYAWLVGILMLMGLAVLLFVQTIPNSGEGLKGPPVGQAPEGVRGAVGARPDRAATRTCARREPCPEQAGPVPAC